MKKCLICIVGCFVIVCAYSSANAASVTINDNYFGGHDFSGTIIPELDIVGPSNHYDLIQMNVDITSTQVIVDIYGRYFNNVGYDDTRLGDLFISKDSWSPSGTASSNYNTDVPTNGEVWEYALMLDNRDPSLTSGTATLFQVNSANIALSGWTFTPLGYRLGHEIFYNGSTGSVGVGSWSINTGSNFSDDSDDYLRFTFDNTIGLDINNFALSWTMTCANDIIQGGSSPVPEPATLLLFGTGFLGLAGNVLRRRKK